MPAVLTKGDTLKCTVGQGTVQSTGADKLVVAGHKVLTQAGVAGKSIFGCAPSGSPPPPTCTTVSSITSGVSTKLFVGGSPVLLAGMAATPDQPHPIGPATAGQSKLIAS